MASRRHHLAFTGAAQIVAALDLLGNLRAEMALFLELGIEGYFTDHPGIGAAALAAFEKLGNN